jgi:RND family efflux transporter MFP subunit
MVMELENTDVNKAEPQSTEVGVPSRNRRLSGRFRWLAATVVLLLAAGVALVVFLARGAGSSATAGRPVPAPSTDPFNRERDSGTAPREGEIVISLEPERAQNARFKFAVAARATEGEGGPAAVRTTATVQSDAYKETPVFPLVGGIVREVKVQLGDRVKNGQVLATIFSNELAETQAAYLGMQAEAERHHQHFSRTAELVELGAASREELEQATAEAKTEQAKLNSMREKLILLGMSAKQVDQLQSADQIQAVVDVPSPVSGILLNRSINPGEVLMTTREIFRVVDLATVWVVGQVYERDFDAVRVGTPAAITAPPYPDRRFSGRVSYIDPRVDPQTRTAQVRVEVANPGESLKLGMFVDVYFGASLQRTPDVPVVLVPREAIQSIGSKEVVYVVADRSDSFVQREVATGAETGGMVAVVKGLSVGERVVTDGSFLLRAESLKLNPAQGTAISAPIAEPKPNKMSDEEHHPKMSTTSPGTDSSAGGRVQTARVRITANGYEPSTIRLQKGVPARVTFVREVEATCSTDVVIEAFGIKKELPFKEPVVVAFTPRSAGEFEFACGMNMLHGKIIIR